VDCGDAGTVMPVATTAVLFDLDDTLFDHRGCTRDALAEVRRRYPGLCSVSADAMEQEYSRLLEAMHLEVLAGRLTVDEARTERFRRLFECAGGTTREGEAEEAASVYRVAYRSAWRAVDGALELLAALHERAAVGVVTNNAALEQRQKIAACGFGPYIDAAVISEEAGATKPDPRIFEIALDTLGRPAGEALMLGDSWQVDIVGARAAGIRPVWFNPLGAPSLDDSVTEIWSLLPTELVLSVMFDESKSPPAMP
jgi:putative hydrolase of the HAD superfamily